MKTVEVIKTGKKVYIPERLTNTDKILNELTAIVGNEHVEDSSGVLYVYSKTMTELDQYLPNMVVQPATVNDVSEILKVANKFKVPVQCQGRGLSMAGIQMLLSGGILIDLRRMDKILEVNDESGYAVIEPGVSFSALNNYLKENHPMFRPDTIYAPGRSSIIGNLVLDGHMRWGTKYGSPYDHLLSAEVVLPTGDIAHVGSRGLTKSWHCRNCTPDLLGLFSGGWHGTTGIVTKASVRILPVPKYEEKAAVLTFDVDSTCEIPRRLARTHSMDAVATVDWRFAIVLTQKSKNVPSEVPADFPTGITEVIFSSYETEEELNGKRKTLQSVTDKLKAQVVPHDFAGPEVTRQLELPTILGSPDGGGMIFAGAGEGSGLSWVGGIGEDRFFKDLYLGTEKIFKKYPPLVPQLFMHPIKWGHAGCFREIVSFDMGDPEQVANVRKAHEEMIRLFYGMGYVLYKPPQKATDIAMKEYADEGFRDLMKKVKDTLDPNGIMAPNRWGISGGE